MFVCQSLLPPLTAPYNLLVIHTAPHQASSGCDTKEDGQGPM